MSSVFISYRREDSISQAGRIYDHLVARFGKKSVFMDIDTLKPGDDFVDALKRTVSSCDVLVAVIGKNWLSIKDENGRQRLQDPADFVLLEVATALDRGIRVIPALVAGAQMPRVEELPESLKTITRRQAIVLSDTGFRDGMTRLIGAVESPRGKRLAVFSGAVMCALLVAAGSWYLWFKKMSGHEPKESKVAGSEAFSVQELARLYKFPLRFNGNGQRIGLIELGGGYTSSDLDTYFGEAMLGPPGIVSQSVDRATNSPGGDLDSIVTMNVEVVGSVAPGAQIVVYFAPNTSDGFVHAVNAATNDETNRPSVLVIAWGSPEDGWQQDARRDLDRALKAAADRNITVVVSSGDLGTTDGVKDGKKHSDFPASSPWVLACGGTRLITPFSHEMIQNEVFWDESGRGVSGAFAKPDWQRDLNLTGRAIPDVAADATTRYRVYVHGRYIMLGGTPAAASLWGGLLALINQGLGRNVGFMNPVLYQKLGPAGVFRKIGVEMNGSDKVTDCKPSQGWNPCTGWGSPDGEKLLSALR
jgi:hypothetical protein